MGGKPFYKGNKKIYIILVLKHLVLNIFSVFLAFVVVNLLENYIEISNTMGFALLIPIYLIFYGVSVYIFSKKNLSEGDKILGVIFMVIVGIFYSVFLYRGFTQVDNEPIVNHGFGGRAVLHKPIIYLYPEKEQEIKVELNFNGDLFVTYPEYNTNISGWEVIAYPDGKIVNLEDNREYSYLFWEGIPNYEFNEGNIKEGFVVEGKNTVEFLQEKLEKLGLTPKEYNEFIVYWYPLMKNNKYNLIHFAQEEYTKEAPLDITPEPDSLLRVFMYFKALDKQINIQPQSFDIFERKGFSVIEWGGSEIK